MISDRIDPAAVDAALDGLLPGPVVWATEVGSTNDLVAMRAREGAPEGLVIGADFQTAGRGRRGRTWASEPGASLLFSLLLRPERVGAALGLLPIAVAVGVADGLARVGVESRLVWPNDVTVAGGKLGGILCETASRGGSVAWTVAGVGINVAASPQVDAPRWVPTSVAEAAGGTRRRQDVLVAVLTGIAAAYAAWSRGDDASIVAAFAARDALAGRAVRVAVGDREVSGTADGITPDGKLRVREPGGAVTELGSGEVIGVDAGGE
jgi:BirA family transcriptional regulator, biotin operon repressor / biotin---[acetyl-CoA-carboxylase] ligase